MKPILLLLLIITIVKRSLKEYNNEAKTILKEKIFNLDKNNLNSRKLDPESASESESTSKSESELESRSESELESASESELESASES